MKNNGNTKLNIKDTKDLSISTATKNSTTTSGANQDVATKLHEKQNDVTMSDVTQSPPIKSDETKNTTTKTAANQNTPMNSKKNKKDNKNELKIDTSNINDEYVLTKASKKNKITVKDVINNSNKVSTRYQNNTNDNPIFEKIVNLVNNLQEPTTQKVQRILQKNPLSNKNIAKKSAVLRYFNNLVVSKSHNYSNQEIKKIRQLLQMKSIRTISGVTPVTVLTKPFVCPGRCIFCPSDVMMPKSYISSEPGAQRALANKFDPYYQTYNRLCAYAGIGHNTDKIELIILGGTWSVYPKEYQIWYIKRCFDAMNDFDPDDFAPKKPEIDMPFDEKAKSLDPKKVSYNRQILKKNKDSTNESATYQQLYFAHKINETAKCRCIGLVVETRPEYITEKELVHIRKLGATKIQIGIQTLDEEVLALNKRGHTVKQTADAIVLLRKYGFKIHGHWMANLYGSNVKNDIEDYKKMFNPDFCPDELKIYPCSLIETAELMNYYNKGIWKPYSDDELSDVLVSVFKNTPRYCRLTRVIRDIPSQEIVVGNKKTNFRQIVENKIKELGFNPVEIRSREVKEKSIKFEDLKLNIYKYDTVGFKEFFIEYITDENEIAGFLRLSLPDYNQLSKLGISDEVGVKSKNQDSVIDLDEFKLFDKVQKRQAMIREIHVYGQSVEIGNKEMGAPQHLGLGKSLIKQAIEISKQNGFDNLSVISSIGTREYYKKRGFELTGLYQTMDI